jgi:hypothetical protein
MFYWGKNLKGGPGDRASPALPSKTSLNSL